MTEEKKLNLNLLLGLLLLSGLVYGGYSVYGNLYHYEFAKEVVAEEEDEDAHEGHDHEKQLTETEQYVQTANLDTVNAKLQLQAARSLHIKGELKEALVFYRRFERLESLSANVASEVGTLLWKLHPGLEAVKYFSQALRQDSLHVNSLYGLGVVSMTIGEKLAAEKYFIKVLEVEPDGELASIAKELIEKIKK